MFRFFKNYLIMFLMLVFFTNITGFSGEMDVQGAGASFPNPIYQKWAEAYLKASNIKINYQSVGSGQGIARIKANIVDFAGSDEPLNSDELTKSNLVQFPMIIGGIVPVFNLDGINDGELKLDGPTLAEIYLGEITKWNDGRIKKLNPDIDLPDKPVIVVHRSDSSGSTWLFTHYLSEVSKNFEAKIGISKMPAWPRGNFYGGKSNQGVTSYIKQLKGSIGYVEYSYVISEKLKAVKMKNRAGKFIKAMLDSFSSAAHNAKFTGTSNFYIILNNQEGEKSWPITGFTYILIHKIPQNKETDIRMKQYFLWCLANGDSMATGLHYVPLPESVKKLVRQVLTK